MPIPFDSKLKKLQILRRRSVAKHKAVTDKLEAELNDAKRQAWLENEPLWQQIVERCRELGYCAWCELPQSECECVWMAQPDEVMTAAGLILIAEME